MKHNYQFYTAVCRPMLRVQVQLNKNFLAITSIQRPCHLWELLLRRIAIRESLNRTDMDVLYTVLITFFLAGKRIVSGKFTAKIYWHFACLHPEAYLLETMRVTQRSIYFHPVCNKYHLQSHKPCIFPMVPSPPLSSIALQFKCIFGHITMAEK